MTDPSPHPSVVPDAGEPSGATKHWLIVTVDEDDDDSVRGSIECSGVTDLCRTWWECDEAHMFDEEEFVDLYDAIDSGEDVHHGVEHRYIDGMIMTPSTQCYGQSIDSAVESANEAAHGLAPGRYPCEIDYEGDEYVSVHISPPLIGETR